MCVHEICTKYSIQWNTSYGGVSMKFALLNGLLQQFPWPSLCNREGQIEIYPKRVPASRVDWRYIDKHFVFYNMGL